MTHVDYIKYTSEYKDATLKLLAMLWSHLNDQQRRLLFEWRYEQNPFAQENYIYLAMFGMQVVGFRAFVPQILECKGNRITGLTAADAIVHPDFRRKGIFSGLIRFFLRDLEDKCVNNCVIYNLSSNEYSTPGYLKLGWQATNGLKRFALHYNPMQDIRLRLTRQNSNKVRFGVHQVNDTTFEISNEVYAEEMTDLIEKRTEKSAYTCIRNTRYFNWRYAFRDKTYIFVYQRIKGKLESFLVLNKVSDSQFLLWEYAASNTQMLKKTIKVAVRAIRIPVLRSWVLSQHDYTRLRRCGFMAAPTKIWDILGKKRLPVLVRPVKINVEEKDFFLYDSDIRNIENWQFFLADRH